MAIVWKSGSSAERMVNSQLPSSQLPKHRAGVARVGEWEWRFGSWELLASPSPAGHRLEADAAADRRGDDPEFRHQPIELRGEHRLRAVTQRVVGIVVHLDDEAVRTGRDGRARELRDHVA